MERLVLGLSSLIFLSFFSCKKEKITIKYPEFNTENIELVGKNGRVFLENGQLFSGKLYSLKQKDTVYKATLVNGLKEGVEYVCYTEGQKKELREYKNGLQDGTARGWYPNGQKMFVYQFKTDVFDGSYMEWYENGKLYRNQHYKKGLELGVQQVWNSDGRIKVNYIIDNGRRYGLLGTKNCKNVTEKLFK